MVRSNSVAAAILWAAVALSGCSPPARGELDDAALVELAALPGAERSSLPALREELTRIREEAYLPAQLASPTGEPDAGAALEGLFEPAALEALRVQIDEAFPTGRFSFSPLALEQVIRLRLAHQAQLDSIRESLEPPSSRLAIDYRRGFFAPRGFVDVCRAAVGLEAFHVAELLADNRLPETLGPLRRMCLVVSRLAAVKHVESRLTAAALRGQTFQVLQAVVEHPDLTRSELAALRELVHQQLAAWPHDAEAWIGDRAQALHGYELIRQGAVLELLTPDEKAAFEQEGSLGDFQRAAMRLVDQDELYYLQTMRTLIEACNRPFFTRRETFDTIRQEQNTRRNDPDFPLVAARMFLPNIESGQQIQAEDRARTEVWAMALNLALGQARDPEAVDPATGKPYHVSIEPARVVVWAACLPESAAIVPVVEER